MVTLKQRILALTESTRETMENLIFSEVEIDDSSEESETGGMAAIALGELGELYLQISPKVLAEIASVIYTLDPKDLSESVLQDTHLEILNIVAGRFCMKILAPREEFQLGIPYFLKENANQKLETDASCRLCLDGAYALRFCHKQLLTSPSKPLVYT